MTLLPKDPNAPLPTPGWFSDCSRKTAVQKIEEYMDTSGMRGRFLIDLYYESACDVEGLYTFKK